MNLRSLIKKSLGESRFFTKTGEVLSILSKAEPMRLTTVHTHYTASGIVGYFNLKDDGNLYEVEIRPIQTSQYGLPDALKPKKNEYEVLSSEDVLSLVKQSLGDSVSSMKIVRDNFKYYDIKLYPNTKQVAGDQFIREIKEKLINNSTVFKFKLISEPKLGNFAIIRYNKD